MTQCAEIPYDARTKPLAIIVDLDGTVCTNFWHPIRAAVSVLHLIDRRKLTVAFVSARPEVVREYTEQFLAEHQLPAEHVYLSPRRLWSLGHKVEQHTRLAGEYDVIASIGDTDEEEGAAARATGVPFVLVDRNDPSIAWAELAARLEAAGGFGPDPSVVRM